MPAGNVDRQGSKSSHDQVREWADQSRQAASHNPRGSYICRQGCRQGAPGKRWPWPELEGALRGAEGNSEPRDHPKTRAVQDRRSGWRQRASGKGQHGLQGSDDVHGGYCERYRRQPAADGRHIRAGVFYVPAVMGMQACAKQLALHTLSHRHSKLLAHFPSLLLPRAQGKKITNYVCYPGGASWVRWDTTKV